MTKVFISYSHKDEEPWKDKVVTHLRVLEKEGILEVWDDRKIHGGDDWYPEIEKAINDSRVAVLLITANFLTSNFILKEEVPRLLAKREGEGMRVIPLIVRPCAWDEVRWLNKINARPKNGRPLSGGTEHQIDADLADLAREIVKLLDLTAHEASAKVGLSVPPDKVVFIEHSPSRVPNLKFAEPALDSPESRGVFGREAKISEVTKELKNTAILTIYGMPGIGKSVLIDEVRKQNEKTFPAYASYRLSNNDTLMQIYTQLALVLGCRDANPMDKFELLRKFNYSLFQEYAKHAKPFLICIDKAQNLFSEELLASREIREFLLAIIRYYPRSKIILESQESPQENTFNHRVHKALKIGGIDKESMARYYRLPFRDRLNIGWVLNDIEAKFVFERLGGKRALGGAHPLAMTLLAMVASELAETPSQVLDRPEHKEKYDLALEASLFSDLYEKV